MAYVAIGEFKIISVIWDVGYFNIPLSDNPDDTNLFKDSARPDIRMMGSILKGRLG